MSEDQFNLVLQKNNQTKPHQAWQNTNKTPRSSLLLEEYFQSWSNLTHIVIICNRLDTGLRCSSFGYQYRKSSVPS